MIENRLKHKLAKGDPVLGVFVAFPSPDVVEMCGYLGFDFVILDAEHGPMNVESAAHLLRAAECAGYVPIVNVPSHSPQTIGRYLDIGAMGIQVPQVNDRAEAEAIVTAVKYHPLGQRGMARPRAGQYGLTGEVQAYMEQANKETMVIASIENIEGVKHLPQIVGAAGIDIFFIGAQDLSQSMGIPGETGTPLLKSAVDTIVTQVRNAGRAVGIFAPDAAAARAYIAKGAQYIVTTTSGLLARAASDYLQDVRRS
jgi:4-hydroxy-2-oxoheptanedioate aldolase